MASKAALLDAIRRRVAALLAERGWTQKDLAKASGIDAANLSRFLTGQKGLRVESFASLARALGVTADSLMGESDAGSSGAQLAARLTALEKRLDNLEAVLREHAAKPTHTPAGAALTSKLERIEQGVDLISRALEQA